MNASKNIAASMLVLLASMLVGCAGTGTAATGPLVTTRTDELGIIVVADKVPLRIEDAESHPEDAETLLDLFESSKASREKVDQLNTRFRSLLDFVSHQSTSDKILQALRLKLEGQDIKVNNVTSLTYDLNADAGSAPFREFQARAIRAAGNGIQLMLIPHVSITSDAGTLHVDVEARVYRNRDPDPISVRSCGYSSPVMAGENLDAKVANWAASSAAQFFQRLDEASDAVAQQCSGLLEKLGTH